MSGMDDKIKRLVEKMRADLVACGVKPEDAAKAKLVIKGDKIRVAWRDVVVEAPMPSRKAWDTLIGAVVGALIALAGVAAGAAVANKSSK